MHLWCLKAAAELFEFAGDANSAARYARRANDLAPRINAAFWDEQRGAYRDRRSGTEFSQITNALAILSEAAPPERWKELAPNSWARR